MVQHFPYPAPISNSETAPFWEGVRAGKLMLSKCDSCDEVIYYPRTLCPRCLAPTSWIEASGNGKIYSHTTVHARDDTYIVALVSLEEGPTLLTNILMPPDASPLQIGQEVRIQSLQTSGEEHILVFVRT